MSNLEHNEETVGEDYVDLLRDAQKDDKRGISTESWDMELRSFERRSSASKQNREHFYVRVENATELRSSYRAKGEYIYLEALDVQR